MTEKELNTGIKRMINSQHEIELLDWNLKGMFDTLGIENKKYAPLFYDFKIDKKAPHASTLDVSTKNGNKVTILIAIPKIENIDPPCPALTETKNIKIADTHFKYDPESKYCYYHYYGENFKINNIRNEIKHIIRDAIREYKRRLKENVVK